MKLEVGMFIRTDDGTIAKIEGFDGYYIFIDKPYKYNYRIEKDDFTKASFNLIDLIEVGDYVNGCEIFINYDEQEVGYVHQNGNFYPLLGTQIKSILTHEQYEANAYKVVE